MVRQIADRLLIPWHGVWSWADARLGFMIQNNQGSQDTAVGRWSMVHTPGGGGIGSQNTVLGSRAQTQIVFKTS